MACANSDLSQKMQTEPPRQHRDYGSVNHTTVPIDLTTLGLPLTSSLITCKVCNGFIDLVGRRHQSVVKCESCQEATPIRRPPKGKKFVRCDCKCLLVVREGALRISCPRESCKKTTYLISTSTNNRALIFTCPYCYSPFGFELDEEQSSNGTHLVKCPHFHCKQISAVGGRDLARKWAMLFFMLSIAFFGVGFGLVFSTTKTVEPFNGSLYIAYIGNFMVGLVCFLRGYHYWAIKMSVAERTV